MRAHNNWVTVVLLAVMISSFIGGIIAIIEIAGAILGMIALCFDSDQLASKLFGLLLLGAAVVLGVYIYIAIGEHGHSSAVESSSPASVGPIPLSTATSGRRARSDRSLCGTAQPPADIGLDEWRTYRCQSRQMAGSAWAHCLSRPAYTPERGRGCPGEDRCCPADRESEPAEGEVRDSEGMITSGDRGEP